MDTIISPVDILGGLLSEEGLVLSGSPGNFSLAPGILGSDGAASAIHIDSPVVSRRHCLVMQRGGRYFLRDLETTNGTWVNGHRLVGDRQVEIGAGDRIRIANLDFVVKKEDEADA
ncbi:MAG: FHA domain-containing protein [Eubacterium sp.]|nr:FHA domain-containing protein [Eubacterium sp.]